MTRDADATPALDGEALARWYRQNRRPLPWRETRDPWALWVSEVMLQQTRVETVLDHYDRFLAWFPGPAALARASEEEALKAWEGMGYYARCRHLRQAAAILVDRLGGEFPRSREAWMALPGVGRSTAGAILSFAFGKTEPVLDANVRRVAVRLLDLREDPTGPGAGQRLWEAVTRWVQEAPDPALHNQAMMELGALVCLPRDPACPRCPLAPGCRARDRGSARDLPVRGPRKTTPVIEAAVAVIRDQEGRIYVQRRPSRGLLGGLWEFPGGKREGHETPERAVVREVLEETGFRLRAPRFLGVVRHAYTHFRVVLHAYEARVPGRQPAPPARSDDWRWVSVEAIEDLPIPEATRKVLQAFRRGFLPPEDRGDGRAPPPRSDRKPRRAARAVQVQAKRSPKRS
ncbi:MAG TPA: A/G-specific adenine glycosylase [Myxococcota bacterium]|nr:A/G-specific adenine glycosylase [Myxococcota bacterium]